jgi:hypothetical protein
LIGSYGDGSFNVDEFIVGFSKRKYVSEFALELNRSVEKYLKAFE